MPSAAASAASTGVSTALSSLHHRLHVPPPTALPPPLRAPLRTLTALLASSLRCTTAPSRAALLLGPPRSGKSLLVAHALHALAREHGLEPLVLPLQLRALPTPLALFRSLAAQLTAAPPPPALPECHAAVAAAVATLRAAASPVVLVLHDFHLLAHRPDAQPALYALLNLLQDFALPAACVALSTQFDVDDALEKRVRSRFAPTHIVLPLPARPRDVLQFLASVAPAPQPDDSPPPDDSPSPEHPDDQAYARAVREVDEAAHALAAHPRLETLVAHHLRRSRVAAPVVFAFHHALVTAFDRELSAADDDSHNAGKQAEVDVAARVEAALDAVERRLFPRDALADAMESLSVVELGLLAALAKAEALGGRVTVGAVLEVYATLGGGEEGLLAGDDGEAVGSADVANKCWERLVEGGLVAREGGGPRHMRAVGLNVEKGEVDHAVKAHKLASTRLKRWARGEARR